MSKPDFGGTYPSRLELSDGRWSATDPGGTGGYFPVGSLRLDTGANILVLDADNGDDNTVKISLTVDGETEVFTQPWSLWGEVLKFEIPMENALRAMCR